MSSYLKTNHAYFFFFGIQNNKMNGRVYYAPAATQNDRLTLPSVSGCHSASSSLNSKGEVTDLEGSVGNPSLLKALRTLRSQPSMTET